MAMTDTRPDSDAPTSAPQAADPGDVEAVLGTGDHKTLGRLWIAVSSLYVVAALVVSAVAGFERIDLGSFTIVEDADMYAQIWSLGRVGLLALGLVPLLIGVATYVVPLQVGSSTLAFPRGAAAAFWCWLVSGALLVASYVGNGGPGGGRRDFTSLWALAFGAVLISLLWALICVVSTVLGLRAQGMTLDRTPISAWSFVVFGTVGLATLPILVAELAVAYIRIRYGDLADGPSRLVLSGVTDGVSLAPGVYWLAIPVLGLGVEALTTHSSVPLRQHRTVMGLVSAFGVLAFGGHFLAFSSLRASAPFDNGLMVVHLLVVPLVVLATLGVAGAGVRRGRPSLRSPLIASGAAGLILVVATSIMALAQIEHVLRFIDDLFGSSIGVPGWLEVSTTTLQDGVRVLVVGAALIAGVGAVHHWGHKIYGRALDEALGMLSMAALALGTLAWGGADVTSGLLDQPREPVLDGNADSVVEVLNALALLGAVLLAAGAALFVVNLFVSTLARRGDVDEPWRGLTLEWATASPPPRGNFAEQPVVRSATPLADPLPEEEVR